MTGCSEIQGSRNSGSPQDPIEIRVNELLAQMTLEEKIGQLTLYTSDYDVTGPSVRPEYREDIAAGRVGAVFNAYTANFTRDLQQLAVGESRLGIPLLFGYDVIHGFKTIFPIPLGESASWNLAEIERSARISATEAAASGLHWTFAPMVDVARDPRWGRIAEGAGEDTFLGSKIATARVKGFQTDHLGNVDTVMATAKHLAAYGAPEGGRDYNTVDVSERTLREVYLPPFKAAADAGAATFMTSFNEIAGVPSSANKWLMENILREEWGWNGFVVSDYTSINELVPHGIAANLAEAGELALEAGLDMDMQGSVYKDNLPALVAAGKVSMETVDEATRRILRAKFKLGLFDDPYKFSDEEREHANVFTDANQTAAREIARKSIVLLKNNDALLPLSPDLRTIAVIGPLADDKRELIGNWSAAGDYSRSVSLVEGIRSRVSGSTKILTARGTDINTDDTSGIADAVAKASQADVIIAALGEEANMSGEASSRAWISIPGRQRQLLQELHRLGKPIVLVLMNGRPLILNWEAENVPAILETWFLGTQSGHAIADVLFGDYNPSGRLPVSFPRSEGQIPLYYNAKNTGRPFSASEKYTSKYLDVPNTPLYPFGFGLSYTTYTYANLRLSAPEIKRDARIRVMVDVTNSGRRAGTETVQLYITDEVGTVTRPVKELRGFQQVTLQPGQTTTVTFDIGPDELSMYDIDMRRVVEPGRFRAQVGPHSDQLLSQSFEVR